MPGLGPPGPPGGPAMPWGGGCGAPSAPGWEGLSDGASWSDFAWSVVLSSPSCCGVCCMAPRPPPSRQLPTSKTKCIVTAKSATNSDNLQKRSAGNIKMYSKVFKLTVTVFTMACK